MEITQNWETGRSCHHPPLRGQDREDVFPLEDGLSELHTHALTLTRSHTHNTAVFSPSPWDFGTPSHSPGRAQPHFPAEVVAGGASLEETWMNPLTVLFAAELLALPRAPRLVMSKWKTEGNQIPASFILHPSLPLPCPSCCQLGERSFVPWPSPAPHEKPSIKPRALQPLLPFQSLFFLLLRIWRDGRSVQSPELVLKSKAGRAKGIVLCDGAESPGTCEGNASLQIRSFI